MQSFDADIADVHRGAFTHRFETFQNLDTLGRIILSVLFFR